MLLVGSRSLETHIDIDRVPADWDIYAYPHEIDSITSYSLVRRGENKYKIYLQNTYIEIGSYSSGSSYDLMVLADELDLPYINTPLGLARNASIEMHKLLKLSSLGLLKKLKNELDLARLSHITIPESWEPLLQKRITETSTRLTKDKFFNKYGIIRYIEHDVLHIWLAQAFGLSGPTYLKMIENSVSSSEDLFLSLSFSEQKMALLEEAIVLALERFYIRKVESDKNTNMFMMWDKFCTVETSEDPCVKWLSKLCYPNMIKDHPDWLARWGKLHYDDLIKDLRSLITVVRDNMPTDFWEFLRELRDGRVKMMELEWAYW